jgi:hypothetical protein
MWSTGNFFGKEFIYLLYYQQIRNYANFTKFKCNKRVVMYSQKHAWDLFNMPLVTDTPASRKKEDKIVPLSNCITNAYTVFTRKISHTIDVNSPFYYNSHIYGMRICRQLTTARFHHNIRGAPAFTYNHSYRQNKRPKTLLRQILNKFVWALKDMSQHVCYPDLHNFYTVECDSVARIRSMRKFFAKPKWI